jgi:glyoxylase-like metal-dependent hydrolase (beta-lactamase superfamily II)
MEIIPNIHLIPDIIANPYLIIDPDGLTLIDTGLPGSDKKILNYIAGMGRSPADLKRIIITHSDMDHIGGLYTLKKVTGARTYASDIEAKAIASGKPSRPIKPGLTLRRVLMSILSLWMKPHPMQVDEILKDGQVLPLLGGLQVVETAGHTPGHISLYASKSAVLFPGDSMVSDDKGLHGSRPAVTWDMTKADESVRKQTALGARIVCPGHGPVVTDAQDKFPKVLAKAEK